MVSMSSDSLESTYDQMSSARTAGMNPSWMRFKQYSIFVLPGPENAWQTAKSS